MARLHRYHVILVLQCSLDQQKRVVHQLEPVLVEELRRDDDIADTSLVFETQKHESLRRARSLSHNHPAGHTHKRPIAQLPDIDRPERLQFVQLYPMIRNRMFTYRQSGTAKVCVHSLRQCHLL